MRSAPATHITAININSKQPSEWLLQFQWIHTI